MVSGLGDRVERFMVRRVFRVQGSRVPKVGADCRVSTRGGTYGGSGPNCQTSDAKICRSGFVLMEIQLWQPTIAVWGRAFR